MKTRVKMILVVTGLRLAAAPVILGQTEQSALTNLNHSTDRTYWRVWTTQGKAGSLMPAFARAEGGPLTDDQINSLADYLAEHIPSRDAAGPIAPSANLPAPQ